MSEDLGTDVLLVVYGSVFALFAGVAGNASGVRPTALPVAAGVALPLAAAAVVALVPDFGRRLSALMETCRGRAALVGAAFALVGLRFVLAWLSEQFADGFLVALAAAGVATAAVGLGRAAIRAATAGG